MGAMQTPAELFEKLPELVNTDTDLVRRGAWCQARIAVFIGETPFYITIADGRITAFERGPALMRSWQFVVKGTAEAWRDFWQPVPEPKASDLFALIKRGVASVEGDLHLFFAHLQYMKDLLAKPRLPAQGAR